jgi:hypothetical protein
MNLSQVSGTPATNPSTPSDRVNIAVAKKAQDQVKLEGAAMMKVLEAIPAATTGGSPQAEGARGFEAYA